jgi:hypothetical protein
VMFTGNENAVTKAELRRYADSAIQTFLAAHAPPPARSGRPSTRTQGAHP